MMRLLRDQEVIVRSIIVAAVLSSVAPLLAARQATTQPPVRPQFRAAVEVVEVDVSVLDDRRRPVRGLVAGDFAIAEDGRPQEIVSFAAIDVPPAEPAGNGWVHEIAPDVRTNLAGADRLLVLVLDDAQVRPIPRHTTVVKELARAVVDRLGPNDLAAVVFTRDNRGAQPFTNDRQRLLASIDGFHGEFDADPLSSPYFYMNSLKTLRYVAESLYDASERRKSVIYVSPGVPLEGNDLDAFERRQEAQRIFDDARRANVNVYALDPSGLGGLDREDTPVTAGRKQSLANDFLHALAANTGGRALVNRNDAVGGVSEVFAENASYYLIGYRSTSTEPSSRFRKIDVQVNRANVTVRARSGYVAARPAPPTKSDGPSPGLIKALREAAPRGDVAMQMTAAPFATPGGNTADVVMAIALRQPRAGSEERVTERVDLLIGAYAPDGRQAASERLNARLVVKASSEAFVRYEVLTRLQLRPGRYQLRVASQSALHAKEGSLHYDLTVPDFARGDLSLSGIVLSVEPNVAVAGRERVAAAVPVVATSRREFWPSDRVSAFLRIYKNRKAQDRVLVTTRVRDAKEQTTFEKQDSLSADRFATAKASDYQVVVPTDDLPRGQYLLTIEAAAGKTSVRRDVRFVKR
jgi:VWFA-related protein